MSFGVSISGTVSIGTSGTMSTVSEVSFVPDDENSLAFNRSSAIPSSANAGFVDCQSAPAAAIPNNAPRRVDVVVTTPSLDDP